MGLSSSEIHLLVFNPIMFFFITFINTILVREIPQEKATTVTATTIRALSSPWLRFSILLSSMRKMVPSHIMFLVDAHYALFMACK